MTERAFSPRAALVLTYLLLAAIVIGAPRASAQGIVINVIDTGHGIIDILKNGRKVFEFGKSVILSPNYDHNFDWFVNGISSVDEFPYQAPHYTSRSDIKRELGFQWRMAAWLEENGVTEDRYQSMVRLKKKLLDQTEDFSILTDKEVLYDAIVQQRSDFVLLRNKVGTEPDPVLLGCVNLLTSGRAIPTGFGAAYNVFSAKSELIVEVECNGSRTTLKAGSDDSNQIVFEKAYVFRKKGNFEQERWEEITLDGVQKNGQWFVGSASAELPVTNSEIDQGRFVAAYICTFDESQWKCGCRNQVCAQQELWALQRFKRE